MSTHASDRTGILIVRVWMEADATEGFRARITQTLDSDGTQEDMATAAHPDGVYAIVRTWVETFIHSN